MSRPLNVLITNSKSGAFFFIANGWVNAFKKAGHNALLWNGDMATWNKVNPDIYIGCSGWRQRFPRNAKLKVAIHTNPYCQQKIQVPNGPIINESQDAINWTIAQKPNVVFGYGLQYHMDRYWSGWKRYAHVVGMPNAADVTKYYPVHANDDIDVGWVGGYWGYKAINLDRYLIPVAKKFKSKWYGWSGPQGLWSGKVDDEEVVRKLFCSAKVCPVVVEPHTTTYGIDMPERIFKVAACGGLVIADPVNEMERYFTPGSVLVAKDPSEYMRLCEEWIKKPKQDRDEMAKKLTKEVLTKHTYYHRIQTILNALGFSSQATEIDKLIAKL